MSSLIPTWRNLGADGGFWVHVRTVTEFLELVVEPGVAALDARAAALKASDDVVAVFELSDLEELREETLEVLQLVGNTCRHGGGASCAALKLRRPDLWPDAYRQDAMGLAIEVALLRDFVTAIEAFWTDAEDVYKNSLKRKHPSVVRSLEAAEARWRGRTS